MTTADKSHNGKTAVLEEPDNPVTIAEEDFPFEATPSEAELEALLSKTAPTTNAETAVVEKKGAVVNVEKPVSARKKWPILLALVFVVAIGIAAFVYLRNQPKPVPTPKSVDLPLQTSTTTNEVPDTAFRISPEKQQLIGVQYSTVEYQTISKSLRAVGKVAFDETKMSRINPKIEGWIEKVYVDFTGKLVKKGQPLLTIYSPDLVSTQEEYLLAIKGRRQLEVSPFPEAVNFSESLVKSARRRLELWDVSDQQISELEKRGTASRAMTLYAPASGFVTTRNAFPRQKVMPETELYAIADLSTVWIIADVYEFEAADIKLGQPATVAISSYPGREFKGKITYIFPQVDNATRTLKVRVELANKNFALKPDMYADVVLKISYGNHLVVPQEAVMDSGSEQLVYVSLKDGYFEPRKVQVGAKVDNKFIVLAGLKAGERVVTAGNFLIDSESRLKSAAGGMGMPGMETGDSKSGEKSSPPPNQSPSKPAERKILYWYDAMNPANHYNKPGKAPDGMDLVPRYADDK